MKSYAANFIFREKSGRSAKERDYYQREKDRYYREKHFEQLTYEQQVKGYKEKREEQRASRRSDQMRKYEERNIDPRDRYSREMKHKREQHYEEMKRNRADKTLNDLRERLLSKRSSKGEDGKEKSSRKERRHRKHHSDPLGGEAGQLVKEIITITSEDKKHRKERTEEKMMTEEERLAQEQRKEKLLEAGQSFLSKLLNLLVITSILIYKIGF